MYVFGNGVVGNIQQENNRVTVEIHVPAYLKQKDDNNRNVLSPGKIRVTYWIGKGSSWENILPYIKPDTQVMFVAQENMVKANDKWFTNYTGISLEFASVAKKQRPQQTKQQKRPQPQHTFDEFVDVVDDVDEEDEDEFDI